LPYYAINVLFGSIGLSIKALDLSFGSSIGR